MEQGAKLLSVFAQAYGDITLKRIENFSEVTYVKLLFDSYLFQFAHIDRHSSYDILNLCCYTMAALQTIEKLWVNP